MAVETVSELRDEILVKCQDSSFVLAKILHYLNQAQKEISGRVQLPALESSGSVNTSTSLYYVAMPTGYQRNLYRCHSTTHNRRIKIYESLPDLERQYADLDTSGNVSGVTVQGSYLYYQRKPSSAEALKLYYLKAPTALTALTSSPSEIPEEFARTLLVSFTLKEIFKVKAMSDSTFVNAVQIYTTEFEEGMANLAARLGPERKPFTEVPDELCLDSYL